MAESAVEREELELTQQTPDVAVRMEQGEAMEVDGDQEVVLIPNKIVVLPGASADGSAASFQLTDEDHTLGNSLRYVIMRNPEVEFCGYSIPHPSEPKLNIRVQTYGDVTAIEAFRQGLKDLVSMCDHVERVFRKRASEGDYSQDPL